jgi:hypothetical protein
MGQRQRAWESNRVAGATLRMRYQGVPPRVGRVYSAHNEDTGNPVVVLAPGQQGAWGHLPSWRVQVSASTQEGCYSLEVQQAPTARGLPELTLALYRLARALAQVEDRPEAAEALLGPAVEAGRARAARRRWGQRGVASAVLAAGVAVLVLGADSGITKSVNAGPSEEQPVALGEVAGAMPVATFVRTSVNGVWLDMPRKPWPGQNLAPCIEGEKEIELRNGQKACWLEVKYDSPEICKRRGYEYKGACYLPSYPPPKTPQSTTP